MATILKDILKKEFPDGIALTKPLTKAPDPLSLVQRQKAEQARAEQAKAQQQQQPPLIVTMSPAQFKELEKQMNKGRNK